LRSAAAARLAVPLDDGRTWRGRRLFGAHKTVGGLLAMPPAAACAFPLLAALIDASATSWAQALWPLSAAQLAWLGFACGLAFMLSELPNSMLKRQLDVGPGQLPARGWQRPFFALADRLDSTIGVLLVLTLLLGAGPGLWFWSIVLGPASHAGFSLWLHRAGIKERAL
jgi:hypothetical protein